MQFHSNLSAGNSYCAELNLILYWFRLILRWILAVLNSRSIRVQIVPLEMWSSRKRRQSISLVWYVTNRLSIAMPTIGGDVSHFISKVTLRNKCVNHAPKLRRNVNRWNWNHWRKKEEETSPSVDSFDRKTSLSDSLRCKLVVRSAQLADSNRRSSSRCH